MIRRTTIRCSLLLAVAAALHSPARARACCVTRRSAANPIAFEYGGDLWITARSGGAARRLTSTPDVETDPHFSPDGSHIAFSRTTGGNTDVYVVAAAGGEPTPTDVSSGIGPRSRMDAPTASASSSRPIARAAAILLSPPLDRSCRRRLRGGAADAARVRRQLLARRQAHRLRGDLQPRSRRIGTRRAVAPLSRRPHASRPHHGSRATIRSRRLPWKDSNDSEPMWIGNTIYFLSDRNFTTQPVRVRRRRSSR